MKKRYIFIGNRPNVYLAMRRLGLNIVKSFVVKNSYLEKELINQGLEFTPLKSKSELINELSKLEYDVLVSNGCPYILPISRLKILNRKFVNIHPSLLPDLKGINPINGAILFNRLAGATCHLMDDGIDSGKPISFIKIGSTENISLGLLYKMSFEAEGEVFLKAFRRNFKPIELVFKVNKPLYYSRKDVDLIINFDNSAQQIVKQIRAFGIMSQGAYFIFNGNKYIVLDALSIKNRFLSSKWSKAVDREIIYKYENTLLIKLKRNFIELRNVIGDLNAIKEGNIINEK